jgi:hypothetical protein
VDEPHRKRSLGRTEVNWKGNIKLDLTEIGSEDGR